MGQKKKEFFIKEFSTLLHITFKSFVHHLPHE